jgi:phage tail tape-measure protein
MRRRSFIAFAVAAAGAQLAFADTYPDRPVTLILPFPAGGSVDVFGRAVALHLGNRLKQPVVVDNRAGAGGIIGATAVAKARKDGYTHRAARTRWRRRSNRASLTIRKRISRRSSTWATAAAPCSSRTPCPCARRRN